MEISAKVIAHSIAPHGGQIASLELTFPRYILPEVNTHKICSLSASSSRAIPTAKYLDQVYSEPCGFVNWRMNQKGMQPAGEAQGYTAQRAQEIYEEAAQSAAHYAAKLADLGIAKEQANRLVEPYTWTRQIMTATSFQNLLALRCHPDAQKEFQVLAGCIKEALENSKPYHLGYEAWHLPYIMHEERTQHSVYTLLKMSAARCARVSYRLHDGSETTPEQDIELFERLVYANPPHMSPAAHQGMAMDGALMSRNFKGWMQFRAILEEIGFDGHPPLGKLDGFI